MVLKELVMLAKAPGYLVTSSFVASPIDNPDKQSRVIAIIFGHLNLAERGRERASNCLYQLFRVPHRRSLRKSLVSGLTMKGKPLLRFGMGPPLAGIIAAGR
jgi:hypothetical protein